MGESAAFLVRSFSQPSPTSAEDKKGNSIQRALTASVSFGRFMSESLDWEKWSAFTNNRYLEEVEKYSKPGSVAEKKAYFEAHFKRRRAAALLEKQNAAACTIPETANAEDKVEDDSSLDLVHAQGDCYVVTENVKEEDTKSSDPVVATDPGGTEKAMEPLVVMGNSLELSNPLDDDVCIVDVVSEKEDKVCRKSMVPVQLKNSDKTPESKRSSMDSSNKRRSYTTSLHVSIEFASCTGATQEDMSSSGLPKVENSRIIRAPAKKYKNSMLPQTSTRASLNIFKQYSVAPSAENKSTVRPHGDSISEAKTADEKVQSLTSNHSKSSNLFGSKARISTVPSSFTFKSEERAVKRREFFEMLEQKAKLKETGKTQIHAKPQVMRRSNDKDFHNSIALETTKGAEAPLRNITKKRTQFVQISTGRPCFPKIEERAAAFKVQDSNIIRPPWRLSAKSEVSKDFSGKNSRLPSHSAKCFPKKHMSENASPNIQL